MLKKFALFGLVLMSVQNLYAKSLMIAYQAPLSNQGDTFELISKDPHEAELLLIKNMSSNTIWLDRQLLRNPGVSAGWSSQLDVGRWSALSWMGQFTLSCKQIIDGQAQTVACAKVIQLYQPLIRRKLPNDSYWVVENKTKASLMSSLLKSALF